MLLVAVQDSRISVEGIKNHPWFKKPLPPHLQKALDELRESQLKVDEQVNKGAFHSKDRDQALEVSYHCIPPAPGAWRGESSSASLW